jgi:erythromycin esterase
VSLGEATHGSREFFHLKHRIVEYLVSELGFTSFGIEANYAECFPISRYVASGIGNAYSALASQRFWVWDTEELVGLIEWMRRWNLSCATDRQVAFFGFDMQSPTVAVQYILDVVGRLDVDLAAMITEPLLPLANDHDSLTWRAESHRTRNHAALALDRAAHALEANAEAWSDLLGADAIRQAQACVTVASQWEASQRPGADTRGVRDRAMADNVAAVVERPGARGRTILWAHNGHVRRGSSRSATSRPMGSHLHERFGDQLCVMGFAFGCGSFRAIAVPRGGLRVHTVTAPAASTFDGAMALAGLPLWAVDLRALPSRGPIDDWMRAGQLTRWVGSVYWPEEPDRMFVSTDVRREFDGLIFIAETSAARPTKSTRDLGRTLPKQVVVPLAEFANLDYAEPGRGRCPRGWVASGGGRNATYRVTVTADGPDGSRCLRLRRRPRTPRHWGFGEVTQVVRGKPLRGHRLTVRGRVAATGGNVGTAAKLVLRVFSLPDHTQHEALISVPSVVARASARPTEPAAWVDLHATIRVPDDADVVAIAAVLTGEGDARFGPLSIDIGPRRPARGAGLPPRVSP